MGSAVLLVHGNARRCKLAEFGTLATADALFLIDVHNAILVHAHSLVLLGAGFVAGMVLTMLARINLVLQGAELAKLQLNAAVTGACDPVMDEGTPKLTA